MKFPSYTAGILAMLASILFVSSSFGAAPLKTFPGRSGMLDMTKNSANPHDLVSDRAAIQAAIGKGGDSPFPLVIYFPAGTYLLDDTIDMSGTEDKCCVTFQGQGSEYTVFKVMENSSRFQNVNNPKAAIKTVAGNMAFKFNMYDLKILIGAGNPGAIGADWISNNAGALENISIESSDGNGFCGLAMERAWPGPCLVKNVTIDGFNYGIRVAGAEYGPTFEGITLKNQKIAGWNNSGNILAIHNLTSINTVPAITGNGGFIILVDANLSVPATKTTTSNAIEISGTTFYGRNVAQTGYVATMKDGATQVTQNPLVEYTNTTKYFTQFNDPWGSLKLEIKNAPEFFETDTTKWVCTLDHLEARNAEYPIPRASLKKAMEFAAANGKSTVYIPHNSQQSPYPIFNGPVVVPPQVKNIRGFSSFISPPQGGRTHLDITGSTTEPLIIEGVNFSEVTIHCQSNRPVVLKHCQVDSIINDPGCGDLFIEDMDAVVYLANPQKVWLRQYNPERLKASDTLAYLKNRIVVNGAQVWILGLKSEGAGNIITANNGAQVEMLGTLLYPVDQFNDAMKAIPAFICNESCMSLMYDLHAYSSNQTWYTTDVVETRDGVKKSLTRAAIGNIVPLYNARKGNCVYNPVVGVTSPAHVVPLAKALPHLSTISSMGAPQRITFAKGTSTCKIFSIRGEKIWEFKSGAQKVNAVKIPQSVLARGISVIKYYK